MIEGLARPDSMALFFSNEFQDNFDGLFNGSLIFDFDLNNPVFDFQFPELFVFDRFHRIVGTNYSKSKIIFNPSDSGLLMGKISCPVAYLIKGNNDYEAISELDNVVYTLGSLIESYEESDNLQGTLLMFYRLLSSKFHPKIDLSEVNEKSSRISDEIKLHIELLKTEVNRSIDIFSC